MCVPAKIVGITCGQCHCAKCWNYAFVINNWYISPMALDLTAVQRAIGGVCLTQSLPDSTLVDGLARLDEFVVIGNPRYATLVTGDHAQLRDRLRATGDFATVLAGAVFVTTEDSAALRSALQRIGMTAIVAAQVPAVALHAALSTLLAEDQAAVDRLVSAGMKVLTQVARRGGVDAVVVELARQIDGWAVMLDAHGQLIASAGAGRLHIDDAIAVAFGKPVKIRHPGLQTHQVGSDRDLVGYLVLSSRSRTISRSRDLGQQASALCDLLLRSHNPSVTDNLGREALLTTLLQGGVQATQLLRRWGVHETSLTAFALATKTRTIDTDRMISRWLDEFGAEHVYTGNAGTMQGFVRDDLADELARKAVQFAPQIGESLYLGISSSASVEGLKQGAVQAHQALRAAMETDRTVVRYSEISTVSHVIRNVADETVGQLAALLEPLKEVTGEHGELAQTLRVFLAHHGAHRASARELGIHRQTLLARIQRIETLTGLSLEHADDRATAWIGLRAAGL